ncbi:MAG: hypothetical protein JWP75_1121 [Frondihabitans sp.]|nr:hypothetical protein [Frondihabitans sp.]
MNSNRRARPAWVIPAALIAQSIIAALTLRDIARRPTDLVRGDKNLWRVASTLNTLGAIGYWTIGRRSHGSVH